MTLENQLEEKLREASSEAHEDFGYYPTRFLEMLKEHGAVSTAKMLINDKQVASGFTKLALHKRLDLSVEHIILNGPWTTLFSDDEINNAKRKLK